MKRDFTSAAPHQLWIADITYVRLMSGFCYVAFITDVCTRKIVGRAVASTLHTDRLSLLALEHALLTSGARWTSSGLSHHSDRGVQYVSVAHTDALVAAGVTASVGTVGDSYDNALAESINGLYKTEIIYSRGVWDSATAVEIAILEWVRWWNTARLHESLAYRTPAEVEAACTEIEATAPAVP